MLEGSVQYIPTRLEWLLMFLNSKVEKSNKYLLTFQKGEDNNTVHIAIIRDDDGDIDDKLYDNLITALKQTVTACAELYGWESWVKITSRCEKV